MSKAEATRITDSNIENILLMSRLSIECCQACLAHLYALMHLAQPGPEAETLVSENFMRVIQAIDSELSHSARTLSHFE